MGRLMQVSDWFTNYRARRWRQEIEEMRQKGVMAHVVVEQATVDKERPGEARKAKRRGG
jgi:hypothetical protein